MDDLLGNCSCVALTTYIPVGVRERGCRPFFAQKLVRYGQYLPRFCAKNGSAPRPLATVPILGQPPSKLAASA